jgi:hypothetical protein
MRDGNIPLTQNDNGSARATNITPSPPDRIQMNQATKRSHLHSERQLDNMFQISAHLRNLDEANSKRDAFKVAYYPQVGEFLLQREIYLCNCAMQIIVYDAKLKLTLELILYALE